MATAQNAQIGRLHRRLGEAGTIETLRPILREIETFERADQGEEDLDLLREQIFESLMRLTLSRPDQARTILLDDLLPLTLRPEEEWRGRSMRRRYNEVLL